MFTLNCKGRLVVIDQPIVMGIVNVTPDSFYSGSRAGTVDDILFRADKMIHDGATILDIGGQSTRPGSDPVSADEELRRVLPAIEALHKTFPEQLISCDTFYASVAKASVVAGASIINDVSAGSMDEDLLRTAVSLNVPYVLTHMHGKPQTMQQNPSYKNVTLEVFDFLHYKMMELIHLGMNSIIVDPGFGFGKTVAHNFQLLRELSFFQELDKPVLVGLSRKATICKTLNITATEALNGTTVMNTLALLNGANILRVHDVKEAVQAIKLFMEYKK